VFGVLKTYTLEWLAELLNTVMYRVSQIKVAP